jgi:1-acyl-sn-glycerol-3-phosphate acyltransferase
MKKKVNLLPFCTLVHLLLIRPLIRLIFGVSIVGKEHLRQIDQFIIIANHNSHLDILLLFQILQPDKICRTHPLAALDYFKKPVLLYKIVNSLFQPIWVDRTASSISTIRKIQEMLDKSHNIIIFPEGTRGETAELQEFRRGIGLIAKQNPDIPIVPVYLEGPERAFPKKALFPLPLLNHITISPPQVLHGNNDDITTRLHYHLIKIAEEEQAFRHHRLSRPLKPYIVTVIGIDGSGKSTLSRQLVNFFQEECCFIGDDLQFFNNGAPNNTQPLITDELRKWVGRKAKDAKNLAFYKIPKITELLLRDRLLSEVKKWYRPEFIFMDGSPLLNMTGWAILYRENFFNEEACSKALEVLTGKDLLPDNDELFKQFPELLGLRKLHLNHLTLPDAVIFLDVKPDVCIKRILSRGEKVQPHENIQKLTKLRNAYKLVCNVLSEKLPVLQITGDKDLDQLAQETATFIKESIGEKNAEN